MLTAERHEPAAAAGYVSRRGRSKGIVIGLLLLALAAAGAYGWYRHERTAPTSVNSSCKATST